MAATGSMNLRRLGALSLGAAWLASAAFVAEAGAQPRPGSGTAPKWPINTLKELHQAFAGRFKLPPQDQARAGMEITIRFSVTRAGEILGEPLFTFATPNVPSETRAIYQRAIADAFALCTPFPLTQTFGEAVAGRPQTIRFIDPRGQRKA